MYVSANFLKVVVFSSSSTSKTIDKSAMLEARKGRFLMDRPFPGVPSLKPPGELKVLTLIYTSIELLMLFGGGGVGGRKLIYFC